MFATYCLLAALMSSAAPGDSGRGPLQAVPVADVRIDDDFWAPRQAVVREQSLPHIFARCEETGRLSNFDKAARKAVGEHEGYFFNDSDVYKAIEAAAYALMGARDAKLEALADGVIDRVVAAQQADGYLNTYFTLTPEEKPWSDLRQRHELYCAGHLIEAGIAYRQATGKRKLFDAAVRFADLIDSLFGEGKRADVPGHQEIELALIKLANATGDDRYFELARFFLDQRGRANGHELYGEYCQDHLPVAEQRQAVGHAVRATYMYSAMTDVAARTGDNRYDEALRQLWGDIVGRKMYVTGGIGPSSHNEGFTKAYDLPNESAYAETCASIGLLMWNHRLNLLHADARYADVLEQGLYNGVLAGISLDGKRFFYTNPLASRGDHHRQPWFACACCPPNIARLLTSLGGYVYAVRDQALYVNLFVGSRTRVELGGQPVVIRQKTRYPWEGNVKIELEPEKPVEFDLFVRIPGWCRKPQAALLDKRITAPEVVRGYLHLRREWKKGDSVTLDLPMPVERMEAHPRVTADRGRVALQRGPLVYCVEAADNAAAVDTLALPRDASLRAVWRSDLLGGIMTVEGNASSAPPAGWRGRLYRRGIPPKPVNFTAIPYFAWGNRQAGEMAVWLPESPTLCEPTPEAAMVVKASHCYGGDTIEAVRDGVTPSSSSDREIPRFTWWDHRGTREWIRYDFPEPWRVGAVAVYWFDDREAGGHCRPPKSWRLLYRDGEAWREVPGADRFGTQSDEFNRVEFSPVSTSSLRLEAQLEEGYSAGILEWTVEEYE